MKWDALPVRFRPCLVDCLKDYNGARFLRDLTAGLVVGVVALPLAMAFGIASGVPPEAGLFTAVIAGFLISALGGSRTQIGGPTGAFIAIVYGIVAQYGIEKLAICTLMAGVILVIMGVARLGKMIQFIPYPVTMGFTSGIAVVIFSGQLKDFFGFRIEKLPPEFHEKMILYAEHFSTLHGPTLAVAAICLAGMFFWPKAWGRRVPASIVMLVGSTLAVRLFHLPVDTIGTRFGGIPQSFPSFHLPAFDLDLLGELIMPAITVALLGAIESLLSAVVADGLTDDRHDSNQELIAQGLANIITPLFGGIPATGAIARTATNIRNGAATPVAGIIHAVVLLVIILVAAPLASGIPLAALSAILVFVSYNMGEWHSFLRLHKLPRSDSAVFLATFGLTVLTDLTVAVEVGMVLAAVLFIRRVSELSHVAHFDGEEQPGGVPDRDFWIKHLPRGVQVYRIQGAFFFATAHKLETASRRGQQEAQTLILVMDQALDIDATGLNALESLHTRLQARHKRLILTGIRPHVRQFLQTSGFLDRLGESNVADTLFHAIMAAKTLSTDHLHPAPAGPAAGHP